MESIPKLLSILRSNLSIFGGPVRLKSPGPFEPEDELSDRVTILRTSSMEDAIEWATREAEILGDGEIDIRPVTEPWDIGMEPRPADLSTRRYLVLRKATAATEAGTSLSTEARARLSNLIEETTRAGVRLGANG